MAFFSWKICRRFLAALKTLNTRCGESEGEREKERGRERGRERAREREKRERGWAWTGLEIKQAIVLPMNHFT